MTRQEIEMTMHEYARHRELINKASKHAEAQQERKRQLEKEIADIDRRIKEAEADQARWQAVCDKCIDNIADQFPGLVVNLTEDV